MTNLPGVSSFTDRHGRERWRYRRKRKSVSLPGLPGEPAFEEAYAAAVEGRERRVAEVARHPLSATPRSFGAAWLIVRRSSEWKGFSPATVKKNTTLTENFLASRVVETNETKWRDIPIADFKRRHAKHLLSQMAATPHAAKHTLTAVRRMILVALDEEWIESDPTFGLKWSPAYKGWRAWTDEEMAKYEERWPIGSTPRLVYALGLWLGHRRSDLVRLRWSHVNAETVELPATTKTGRTMILPITPMLRAALDAAPRAGETILFTAYGEPFSEKSLTGRMRMWTKAADLADGCTLHGLRKTLGRMLAESGASTRQLMEVLGHDDIEHAELYSRDAERKRLARDGMDKVVQFRLKASG